jgi:hypothetical protein
LPEFANTRRSDLVPIVALLLLGSLAFVRLMALPAFEDEATQLRWIWRAVHAGEWLQPLGDGKPLEVWPMVPLLWLGIEPPLAATRALHVVAGMLSAVLTFRLALRLGDRGAAFASGALFAICPFVVYLQRLALSDMLLCTAGLVVLLSVIRLLESPTGSRAAVLASSLVLAVFCKMPVGWFFLTAMPLAWIFMPHLERRRLLQTPARTQVLAAYAPVALLALAMVAVTVIRWRQGQSPGFGLTPLMCVGLRYCPDIGAAMGVARPNLLQELTTQLSVPVTVIGLTGVVASALLGDWRRRWLIAVGALPMLLIGLFAGFWYSRYLLFTLPPLIIASVSGWRSLAMHAGRFRIAVEIAVLLSSVVLLGRQSALLILDPSAARWSPIDRVQYFEGWGSGYGYPEAARFVLASSEVPAMIYSLDGHSTEQLRNYLPAQWAGRVRPVFYGEDGRELRNEEDRLRNLLRHTPAWIIIPVPLLERYLKSTFGPRSLDRIRLRQLATFDKPGSRVQLGIYEVTATQAGT